MQWAFHLSQELFDFNFQTDTRLLLSNKKISIQTRLRTLKAYIWPIMNYACETWNIGKEEGRNLIVLNFGATGECKKSVGRGMAPEDEDYTLSPMELNIQWISLTYEQLHFS